MITREYTLEQVTCYSFEKEYDLNRIAFFDIETTGLAADTSYLYLIGCAYYKDSSFRMIQWFSEGIQEETLLITFFFEFLKNYDVLFHYNGSGFDIPYLQRKCSLLSLDYTFDRIISIDIYKKILPFKKMLKLDSLKQKSIELFLGIHRKDTFGGGDLISVYQSYLGKKHYETLKKMRNPAVEPEPATESDLMLSQLLLHNEDDVKGLLYISPIFNYFNFFEGPIRILQAKLDHNLLYIDCETISSLPARINFGNDLVKITAFHNTVSLSITVYDGELKHFYENYKDYFYLPEEDYAIHKSLAAYVDKDYRTKAKPSNCYIKKQGIFAPQYEMAITPCFKNDFKDKLSFLEVHTNFLLQEDTLEQYVHHILGYVISHL